MDVGSMLAHNARKFPDVLAIECEGRSYTYEQFNEESNRLAHGLFGQGIRKGEKIALMMKNSDHFAFSFFAAAKIGAVVVPVNFRLTSPEVHYILKQSDSTLIICDGEFEQTVAAAREGTTVRHVITIGTPGVLGHHAYSDVLIDNKDNPPIDVSLADDFEILYTSGTTGQPKGALFDHERIFKVALAATIGMGLRPRETFLHIAPLFHSAELNLFLVSGVLLGATHIIQRDFHPVSVLEAIEKYKITNFFGVPAMYNFLLQVPNTAGYDLSSIKRCGYGAAPMAPELVRKSMELFGTDQFFNLCGLTEAGPGGVMLEPEDHKMHLGKGGKPIFITEAKVVNEEGIEVTHGAVGEFILRGGTIMKEYYKKTEETSKAIKNGWLYTGDLATVDSEGFITLVDRKKDMIISGGENVYSIEVEEVLYEHPSILEAAIVGLPDEVWGEAVCAVIVPKPGAEPDLQEIRAFCRQKLAGYKVPRRIFIEKELPRNGSGKILKYQLRQALKERQA
ncbi:long-chain-fatty-acid--CoA ligase [Bacillus sp. FJAT-27251]|uniref:long-chain-fatty-acid--CoA ligase n=1 Tax=Bacillus sp. FJAT-27251 TaxID=1684142 RepID=UPI0006A7D7F7|nr:long-chain-fatty-acid--CoA ligase [Bacillus sp. FJAT-27251]